MKKLLLLTGLLFSITAFAQKDTLYLNANWYKCSKSEAMYYRVVVPQGNQFLVKDVSLKTGQPQMIAVCSSLEPLTKNGPCTYYYNSGAKEMQVNYVSDVKDGMYIHWDEDGKDSTVLQYEKGYSTVIRKSKSDAAEDEKRGSINSRPIASGTEDGEALSIAEKMPSFPGGEAAMMEYIQGNVKYPGIEKKSGISGICYVTFVVEKDGSITDVKILRGVPNGPGIDAESIRVVKAMPKWNPGQQYGKDVRVQFNLPIKYTLRETKRKK